MIMWVAGVVDERMACSYLMSPNEMHVALFLFHFYCYSYLIGIYLDMHNMVSLWSARGNA